MMRIRVAPMRAARMAHLALRTAASHTAVRRSVSTSTAARSSTAAAADSSAPPPRRMTYMQEQTALEEAAAAAAIVAAAKSAAEAAAKASSRTLCSSLYLPSSVRAKSRRPRALLTHMGALAQAGLVRHTPSTTTTSGHTLLLPLGARVLSKLEALLDAELAPFHAQRLPSFDATRPKDAHAVGDTMTPYPPALISSISQLTMLVADDFRSGSLRLASLRTDPVHPAGAASAPLWRALKRTHDIALFDTKHEAGLERYHALVDAFRMTLVHACGKQQVHVVDAKADRSGLAAVDADLAHEAHVEVDDAYGSSSLLRCTHCDYAAKPGRAVSLATPAQPAAASTDFPPALQEATRAWARQLVGESFPPHVIDQLKLNEPSAAWKVEMVYRAEASAPKLLYLVLMRADHDINLDAVSEHVSEPQLQRVDSVRQAVEILRQQGAATDELLQLAAASSSSSTPLPSITFDPRPELLIEQALVPTDVDLDLEVIEDHAAEEAAEEQAEAEEQELEDAAAAAEAAPAALADATFRSRMEKNLSSSVSKLKPGEAIDMVELEMQSRGLNVAAAKAQLFSEALSAQKQQHQLQARELQEEQRIEELKVQVDADDAAPAYDPTLEPVVDAAAAADAPLPAEAAVFSALIPHFEYSKQGFFRMAHEGEACAICEDGALKRVHTHVLANTAFIGRQELVCEQEDQEDEPDERPIRTKRQQQKAKAKVKAKAKAKAKAKKQFLHTSFGRFSTHDLFAHLASKNIHAPAPAATAAANPLNVVPTIHFPPLVAPYQVVLIPVTQETTSARDRLRTAPPSASEAAAAAATVFQATEELHDACIAASLQQPALSTIEHTFPSLEGELLIDDHHSLSTPARVQQALSLGVPILLLLSASSLSKGYATLLLNKKGVPVEPRRIALEGLPHLVAKMVHSNYASILQAKRLHAQQLIEKQQMAEDMRRMEEEAEQEEGEEDEQ